MHMNPTFLICLIPFISLLSCTAPTGKNGNSSKPVHTGGKFVFGDKKQAASMEPQDTSTQAQSTANPLENATAAAPSNSWFSFLQKKEPPKALAAELTRPAAKSASKTTPTGDLPRNPSGNLSNDGLRLPDMLTMPEKGEFQSGASAAAKTGGVTGAVTVRPPTDPPARPKPKEKTEDPK